jgi:3-oxoacyl-[acyl-carrier protein] reductase
MSDKRVVLVTGASRGIGRAIALRFAGPDTVLLINDVVPEEDAGPTLEAIRAAGAEAAFYRFDVADSAAVQENIDAMVKEHGRLDVLVNNAGITRDSLLVRMKDEDWDKVLSINLRSVFLCSRAAAKVMMKQRSGRIVSIASVVGVAGNAGQCNYSASKAGIIGFTRSLAREVIARGVTVNAVAPGFIETEMTRQLPEKAREAMLAQIPAGRYGQPEDVAAAAFFLASEEAAYMTGQVLHVNGGMFMG